MPPPLLCPVRDCGAPLRDEDRCVACPRGHRFDRAKSGYLNLLQPQERRSRAPGDSAAAAQARRRLFDAGIQAPLLAAVREMIGGLTLPANAAALDVGCGEGSLLGRLAAELGLQACGVDLSTPAIDLAARRFPDATWIVANADRRLPWADGSFDLVLSILARLNPHEFRRVLAPGGALLLAVPGQDDLAELRELLYGKADARDRLGPALESLQEAGFAPLARRTARWQARLDAAGLADVLALSYRGARQRERARMMGIAELDVTLHAELVALRRSG
ncbi:MAG: methyltransferase domain-containing protein [Acidobacteriota bacterium]